MTRYGDRFLAETYAKDEPVGARLSSEVIADTHEYSLWIPERLFHRIQNLARAYELHLLPALEPYGKNELTHSQAETLVDELSFIGDLISDELLAGYIGRLIELAEKCIRSARQVRLVIEGP